MSLKRSCVQYTFYCCSAMLCKVSIERVSSFVRFCSSEFVIHSKGLTG